MGNQQILSNENQQGCVCPNILTRQYRLQICCAGMHVEPIDCVYLCNQLDIGTSLGLDSRITVGADSVVNPNGSVPGMRTKYDKTQTTDSICSCSMARLD